MKLAFDFAGRRVTLAEDKDEDGGATDAENFLLFKVRTVLSFASIASELYC